MAGSPFLRSAVLIAVGTLVCLLTAHCATATTLGFRTADFTILNASGAHVIGSVHFDVDGSRPGTEVVTSKAHYNDGQYEIERDEFDTSNPRGQPTMSAYMHNFFRRDHTVFLESAVNFLTGEAECANYRGPKPLVIRKTLAFPPDSYAGAAAMLPLQKSLQAGADGPIVMHDFACMPDPRVVKVEAYVQTPAPWSHYPGQLVRTNIKPDLGWLDYIIAPFLPEMHAWFSPSDNFHLVGEEYTRFYKGPKVIIARSMGSH
jgi:hypothetical protein